MVLKKQGRRLSIFNFSITSLTLLGFSLVALPLVMALLFGASQVNTLAEHSEDAIIDVAKLLENQQLLKNSQTKMERSALKYLVLRDNTLEKKYIEQRKLLDLIIQDIIINSVDIKLKNLANQYAKTVDELVEVIIPEAKKKPFNDVIILVPIQDKFNTLTTIYEDISLHCNQLNTLYISNIKSAAQNTRDILIKSLIIIPLSLIIAALFIFLINKPLKRLTQSILRLQQGKFDQEIQLIGSPEIKKIAQALENMRTRLQALELQKSSFIRHISHELKTPLAAIREGTELLYDHSVGQLNPDQQEISHIIKNSVYRLQQHIEDLLDFNIVLDSTSLQDSEKILIDDIVTQVIAERKLDIKRKKIQFSLQLNQIYIISNKKQITVIIDNLLSNAIKYSPNNGIIIIETVLINQQLQLTMSDQGIGISDDNKIKIFEAFYQGPPPDDSIVKGSGLGLTIVKELILRLNGQVELLSSKEQSTGTKIRITLPRAFFQKEQE